MVLGGGLSRPSEAFRGFQDDVRVIYAPPLQTWTVSLQLVTGGVTHDGQTASHPHRRWISVLLGVEERLQPRLSVQSHSSAFVVNSNEQKLSVRSSVRCLKRSSHRDTATAAALARAGMFVRGIRSCFCTHRWHLRNVLPPRAEMCTAWHLKADNKTVFKCNSPHRVLLRCP